MSSDINPIIIIDALRKSDSYIINIFKEGSCYKFYEFLRVIYPNAMPYINKEENHVVTKINSSFYDITGKIARKYESMYFPINEQQLKKS